MKNKIFKAISVVLALVVVLSTCICAVGNVLAAEAVYYVSAGGADTNAGTQANPLLTVNGAIKKAVEANYKSGDTVTVKVMGEDTVSWGSENKKMAKHSFMLCITSASSETVSTVGEGSVSPNFGGEVEFQKIKVNFGNTYKQICANGNNVTFTKDAVFGGNAAMSHFTVGAYDGGIESQYDNDITIVNYLPLKQINLLNNYTACVLNGKLHFIYENATTTPKFYLSAYDNNIQINNAINIELRASSGADFVKYSGGSNPVFGENGCIQILNSGTKDIVTTDTILDEIPDNNLWVINNKIGASDLLSFTNTKGKYAVNTALYSNVTATSVNDETVVITEKDGYLTLGAGEYNVTAEKIPQYTTFYVSANGDDTNDGKTENTAVTTVQKAVELANTLGYISTDTVTVKLLGENVNMGDLPNYGYNLVIEGTKLQEGVTRVTLNAGKAIANCINDAVTTYKTAEIYLGSQWSRFEARNSDIVFESDSKVTGSWCHLVYGTNNDGGASKTFGEQTVVFKTSAPQDGIGFANFGWGSRTYDGNINLVIDHFSSFKVRFNTYASGEPKGSTKYNKNVNLYLNNVMNLSFACLGNTTFNAGLNIFNNCDFLVYDGLSGYEDLPENTWILNNKSDVKVPIIATEEAGKFTTELDYTKVKITATNAEGEDFLMQDGILTLANPGTYDIKVDCIGEHKFGDYTADNNAACEKNETKSAYCEYCNKVDSREIEGTALEHIYSSEVDKICDRCEAVRKVNGAYMVEDSISGDKILYIDGTIHTLTGLYPIRVKAEDGNGYDQGFPYEYVYHYFVEGKFCDDTTFLSFYNQPQRFYYVENGILDDNMTGLFKHEGQYIYMERGIWDNTYTGLVKYSGKWFYIQNGVWNKVNALVKYENKWFYVQNGKWSNKFTDLVKYNGKWFYIKDGKWNSSYNDLIKHSSGKYFFVKNGKWDSTVQALFKKNNKTFAVKGGKWYKSKGIIYHSGKWYYVDKGFAQLKVSSKVKIGDKTYTVKAGKIISPKLSKPTVKPTPSSPSVSIPVPNWKPSNFVEITEKTEFPTQRILCWGDSITYGMGMSKENKYPSVLQSLVGDGFQVLNGGSSGEKSHTIAARQGAYDVFTDKDLVFDAGVSKINIGVVNDHSMILEDGTKISIGRYGDPFTNDLPVNKVYINDVEYKFSYSGSNYYLERSDSSESFTIPKGSKVVFESSNMQKGAFVEIFYVGANDSLGASAAEVEYLVNRYKKMIARHGNDNYLVIIPQWHGIDSAFTKAFKEAFGDKAVHIRKEMCTRDLSTVGLTPTDDDIALQKKGIIPTALKYNNDPTDSLHFNEYGYKMLAQILYDRGVALGYWK